MNYFKHVMISILWIPLLCPSLFASPSLEDMAIDAEYIGVVNITKAEDATVTSVRMGWNRKSEDNVSRYLLETIETIKGDVPADGKLIMDIWQKDYFGKAIKPLSTNEQALVFLVQFEPLSDAWVLKEKLGHLTPIADLDARPHDFYYGIRSLKEDGMIDIVGKPYTISQIKNIIDVCNSAKFKELQSRAKSYEYASLSNGNSRYADRLKLYQKQYKMCPTGLAISSMDFTNEMLEKEKLSWQIKRAGLPILLFEILFFLLFFAMGYYGKWRWTGMLYIVYIGLITLILLRTRNIPLVALLSLLLPFASYGLGIVLYRAKKGTWLQDKVKDEMAQSFLEGEDEDGAYVVWENERTVFSRATMIAMAVLSLAEIFLIMNADNPGIPAPLVLIPLIILVPSLIFVLVTFNRLRYRYGCYDKGYAYGINDSRMKLISALSITIGTADSNPTLVGSGLISSSGIGNIRREWSSVKWCRYDDDKKIIVINHGCCKSDKLHATERSYNGLKAIVIKAIGEKCTGINMKRSKGGNYVK